MANFSLSEFDYENDIEQIKQWKKLYKNTPEYKRIVQYILDNNENDNLARLFRDLHDKHRIGNDEINLVLVSKDETGNIVGALVVDAYGKTQKNSKCYVHFVLTNPAFHHQGVAKNMLKTFFLKPEEFLGTVPNEVFANIRKNNQQSLGLFKSLGFDHRIECASSRLTQVRAPLEEIQAHIQNQPFLN